MPNLGQIRRYLEPCDLKIWRMTLTKQKVTSSVILQALCIISLPLSYSPETPNLGQIRQFLEPCDLEIWWLALKNHRAPLLSNIKLYASFHHHMWIQTGVTVWKWLSWVVTSMTLTFDLWPWPFAWALLWSLVITPENFMMIRWREHSQKGVTDWQTDRQRDGLTDIFQYEQTHNMMQVWTGKLSELQLPVQNPAREGACTSMSY